MYKYIKLLIFVSFSLATSFSTSLYGQTLIDDFSNTKQHQSVCFSQGRTWYTFGGLSLTCGNNMIEVSGNLNTWSGFGIDPGPSGQNGAPIFLNNCNEVEFHIIGRASGMKLELYDQNYKKYEIWTNLGSGSNRFKFTLPDGIRGGNGISKLQFVFSPGNVSIRLTQIGLR